MAIPIATVMTIPTTMTIPMTDAALLTLTQWLSPAFPLGAFAYSHALEVAISEGAVNDADTLEDWLALTLRHGGGKVDAWLLSMTLRGADPCDMAALAESLAGTKERWAETSEQGAAFARTVRALSGEMECEPAALPVSVGQAGKALGLEPKTVISLYLHSFASNLVSAGVRFVPLGQSAGQRVLGRLHRVIGEVAETALRATPEGLTTGAFAADLSAARHEDMEVRLFKS